MCRSGNRSGEAPVSLCVKQSQLSLCVKQSQLFDGMLVAAGSLLVPTPPSGRPFGVPLTEVAELTDSPPETELRLLATGLVNQYRLLAKEQVPVMDG